ncbi:hypothetical protein [Nevskia soli]|uniref:hypothetical protein n=1 Tax=Nevskia soli TaxID=418856 RepID=UPI0012F86B8E|nr:hypothetical protein [Nevskia soli]
MSKTQRNGPGFWTNVQRFFEALEGLEESYPERLECRVNQLEAHLARLLVADKATLDAGP